MSKTHMITNIILQAMEDCGLIYEGPECRGVRASEEPLPSELSDILYHCGIKSGYDCKDAKGHLSFAYYEEGKVHLAGRNEGEDWATYQRCLGEMKFERQEEVDIMGITRRMF